MAHCAKQSYEVSSISLNAEARGARLYMKCALLVSLLCVEFIVLQVMRTLIALLEVGCASKV